MHSEFNRKIKMPQKIVFANKREIKMHQKILFLVKN